MIKYLHIRKLDEEDRISPKGGITLAYTCTSSDICLAYAICHDNDLFCYEIARRIARGRLQAPTYDVTVIPLEHPISITLVDWVSTEIFEVPVDIFKDEKGRWVSTFFSEEGEELTVDEVFQAEVQQEMYSG